MKVVFVVGKAAMAAVLSFSLSACGENIPSAADGKKILDAYVSKEGCLKLNNFEKTNAVMQDFFGMKVYEMEYVADYELVLPCFSEGYDAERQSFSLNSYPKKELSYLDQQVGGKKKFEPGTKFTVKGKVAFTKKEKGWEGQRKW